MRALAVGLLAAAFATSAFAASLDDRGSRQKLSDDSWLWSTGDFHPDRGLPDEQLFKRNPEGDRDTA